MASSRGAGCALWVAVACSANRPASHAEPRSQAAREIAWLEEPTPPDTRGGTTNALGPDPPSPPAPTVFIDDPGASPRLQVTYGFAVDRVDRFAVALTTDAAGTVDLTPPRPYQIPSFVAHVEVSSRVFRGRSGPGAWQRWWVLSIEGESPTAVRDDIDVGVDLHGTTRRVMQGDYVPHEQRVFRMLYAVNRCLRAMVQPLPGEAIGAGASWHGETPANDWGPSGKRVARYQLRSFADGRLTIVASGETIAVWPKAPNADQLMEGESYDVSDKTTFTREVDVRLDSPIAEGRQTEIVVVTGLRKHEGAIVPFDARFTLECRVRRE